MASRADPNIRLNTELNAKLNAELNAVLNAEPTGSLSGMYWLSV
jgi:hypothetical protein